MVFKFLSSWMLPPALLSLPLLVSPPPFVLVVSAHVVPPCLCIVSPLGTSKGSVNANGKRTMFLWYLIVNFVGQPFLGLSKGTNTRVAKLALRTLKKKVLHILTNFLVMCKNLLTDCNEACKGGECQAHNLPFTIP